MIDLKDYNLNKLTASVFKYFEEICSIPHGSGNMKGIADYCENFAQKLSLKYIRDNADNIIIFKNGQKDGQNAKPIILQGHLDMVCQSTAEKEIDFLTQKIDIMLDGDFITADGTTLGADNGIAVAYIMAILASVDIPHPPIEAIFTTDEEIGLLGANALDTSVLKAKRMINLDSEDQDILTVSCAGGQDVLLKSECDTTQRTGSQITLKIEGLLGGHSGVEIDKGRINANVLLGDILSFLKEKTAFSIININGGNKPNAIPDYATAQICTTKPQEFLQLCQGYMHQNLEKIKLKEPDFKLSLIQDADGEYNTFSDDKCNNLIKLLVTAPNGVIKMSEEIDGLVETSLNLGVLRTIDGVISLHYALRSNKREKLLQLTDRVVQIGKGADYKAQVSGFYPPWEFNADSSLREIYKECFKQKFGKEIKVKAIHAGLECAVFSATIKGLDCISVGPDMSDVHTPNEKLSIPSAISTFELLLDVLLKCCNL